MFAFHSKQVVNIIKKNSSNKFSNDNTDLVFVFERDIFFLSETSNEIAIIFYTTRVRLG